MIKKTLYIILTYFILYLNAFAEPNISCGSLPWCKDEADKIGTKLIPNIISTLIEYIAIFAVISIMISGLMYLVSLGDEGKTKKAKNWIIYSLVGTFISISAWLIINLLNNISF